MKFHANYIKPSVVSFVQKAVCFIVLLFIQNNITAQRAPDLNKHTTAGEKIKVWHVYCNQLLAKADYKQLIAAARKGITLCPPDSLRPIGMFSLFAGVGYEFDEKFDEAIHYFNETIKIAKEVKSNNHLMTALSRLENIYDLQKKTEDRKQIINTMVELGDSLKDLNIQLLAVSAMSGYYSDLGNYDKSIEYRIKDIDLLKQKLQQDPADEATKTNIGYAYNNLANVLFYTGHPEKSLEYLNEGRGYIGDKALKAGEEKQYIFFIQAFLGLDKPDSAMYYYKKTYADMPANDTIYRVLSMVNQLLGEYYLDKKDIQKATQHAYLGKKYALLDNDINTRILSANLMGSIYFLQKNYKAAITELQLALQNDFEFDKENEAEIRKKMADAYAHLQQWDSAYKHLEIYSALSDSLLIQQANANFANAEARYQNREKAQQISVQKSALEFAHKQRYWLIAGISMLALLAVLLFIIYKNKQRNAARLAALNAQLEEANHTKATLFGIIGHDLRSPVHQVHQYMKIQQQSPELIKEEDRIKLGKKIQHATAVLLDTMEDLLLWSKTQMDNFTVNKAEMQPQLVIQQTIDLLTLQAEEKNIHIHTSVDANTTIFTDEDYIRTIIRNLLQNAIKASPENGNIFIKNIDRGIIIQNNGPAFTQADYTTVTSEQNISKGLSGLGLRLVKELAERIHADIYFTNPDSNTTLCTILFKHIG